MPWRWPPTWHTSLAATVGVLRALNVCWGSEFGEASHLGPGAWETDSTKKRQAHQSQTVTLPPHHHTPPCHPGAPLGLLFPSRKPRLPTALPSQLCPVSCCPCHLGEDAQLWTTRRSLKDHVEKHSTGLLEGQVTNQWPIDSSLQICLVCSRLISTRTTPCCPRCCPSLNPLFIHGMTPPSRHSKPARGLLHPPLRTHIPKATEEAWARCLLAALSGVTSHSDTRASTDLTCLQKLVLHHERWIKPNSERSSNDMRRMCGRNHKCSSRGNGNRTKDLTTDPHDVNARGTTLVKEGLTLQSLLRLAGWSSGPQLRKGCLGDAGPSPSSRGHSQEETSASLLTVVQDALLSFARDPAAGLSSLHPQLFNGGVLPGCRDEVTRSLHAIVRILAEGNNPGPVVSIASASLTALKKKDGGHWRVVVGGSLRRLTAKAMLKKVAEDMAGYLRPTQPGFRTKTRLWSQCPRHQTMAPKTRQRRETVLVDHSSGECFQPDWPFLFFFREIRWVAPNLTRYCASCYANHR